MLYKTDGDKDLHLANTAKCVFKHAVPLVGIKSEIMIAIDAARATSSALFGNNRQVVVTSTRYIDKHSTGSRHYMGMAVDIRAKDLSIDKANTWSEQMSLILGNEYDIVVEAPQGFVSHIHIEYDPKHQRM